MVTRLLILAKHARVWLIMARTATNLLEDSSFSMSGDQFVVTPLMKEKFRENGYIVVRSLLNGEELKKLKHFLEEDGEIMKHSYGRDDGHGRYSRMCLWNHPGEDITGMVGRCEKMVTTMEDLLGGEVYHYHTKLMMKEAHTGGSFVWHQDYGYWYNNGCLFPDMGTVFVAIDKCTQENGCLKVLKGSHHAGRIAHIKVGDQVGADTDRVDQLMKVLPLVDVELEAGDALFFHSNVLHRSDQNSSDYRRWAFLIAYNRATNNPVKIHHHPQYIPLNKVPNCSIVTCKSSSLSGKDFHDPANEKYN